MGTVCRDLPRGRLLSIWTAWAFIFRVHLVLGMTLFVLFPFSRLVHIWSAPVEYLTRKYQVVRARR